MLRLADLGQLSGALVFGCVPGRLEFPEWGVTGPVGQFLVGQGAAGFSTYGEQYDGVQVNQSRMGVAFGG